LETFQLPDRKTVYPLKTMIKISMMKPK